MNTLTKLTLPLLFLTALTAAAMEDTSREDSMTHDQNRTSQPGDQDIDYQDRQPDSDRDSTRLSERENLDDRNNRRRGAIDKGVTGDTQRGGIPQQ